MKYVKIFKAIAYKAVSDYYKQLFDSKANSIKQLWINLNSVCSLKPKRKKTDIPKLCVNNVEISNKSGICNELNSYFCNIGNDLVAKLSKTNISNINFKDYLSTSQKNSMGCYPVDVYELSQIITGLNITKSTGYDNIGPKLLKCILPYVLQPLLFMYNMSFSTDMFPDILKIAKALPFYKKDDPQQPRNYRPISLLSIFSIVLEKLMHKRLYSYLENIAYCMIINLDLGSIMVPHWH